MPDRTRRSPLRLVVGSLAIVVILQGGALAWRSTEAARHAPPPRGGASDPAVGWSPSAAGVRLAAAEGGWASTVIGASRTFKTVRVAGVAAGLPVPPSGAARVAVRAALSAIGTPYSWGGTTPSTGFDCSGLTSWAWAQAGVSLPHNSGAQYGAVRSVPTSQLRPGDLVFFYSPISHVGMYIGNGLMVDAQTMNDTVGIRPVWWDSLVGAARPGV